MKTSDIKNTMLLDALFGLLLMPLMILLGPAYRWLQEWPLFLCWCVCFCMAATGLCGGSMCRACSCAAAMAALPPLWLR